MSTTRNHRFALPPVWRAGLIFVITVVVAVLIVSFAPTAAHATNHPEPEPTPPATIHVDWLIPGYTGDVAPSSSDPDIWDPEQVLYTVESCGVLWIQGDDWKYSTPAQRALADSIIAKGTLGRVNGTPEDSALYISHEYRQQVPCVQPPAEETPGEQTDQPDCVNGTVTSRSWVDVVRYTGDASGWTALPAVREQEASSIRQVTVAECPPVVVDLPAPPPELAAAGDEGWYGLGLAALLTALGVWALAHKRRGIRRSQLPARRTVSPSFGRGIHPLVSGSLERLPVTLGAPMPVPAVKHAAAADDPWRHVSHKDD